MDPGNWWQLAHAYPIPRTGTSGQRGNSLKLYRKWLNFYYELNFRYNLDIGYVMRWLIDNGDSILLSENHWPWLALAKWPVIFAGDNPVLVEDGAIHRSGHRFRKVVGLGPEIPDLETMNPETHRHFFPILFGRRKMQLMPPGLVIMPLLDPSLWPANLYTGGRAEGLFILEEWLKPFDGNLLEIRPVEHADEQELPVYEVTSQMVLYNNPDNRSRRGTMGRGMTFSITSITARGKRIYGKLVHPNRWGLLQKVDEFFTTWRPG